MSSALCYQVQEAQGGGRAKPSGGRTPRGEAPERATPGPPARAGRAERRRRRDPRPQRRAGGGGEAPQGRANGKAQSPGRGRRRGRPAAAAPPGGGRARGRPGPRRGPPGKARRFEAREGARAPRTGRRKRGPPGPSTTAEARPKADKRRRTAARRGPRAKRETERARRGLSTAEPSRQPWRARPRTSARGPSGLRGAEPKEAALAEPVPRGGAASRRASSGTERSECPYSIYGRYLVTLLIQL